MQSIISSVTIFSLKLLAKTPIQFLYAISSSLSWIAYHIIGYRKNVIQSNLKIAFPEKTDVEINQLSKKYYSFLTDLVVESIKIFDFNEKQLQQRVSFDNIELFQKYAEQKQPVIIAIGHYANWEMFGIAGSTVPIKTKFYSLYRKLNNDVVNEFIGNNRSRYGLGLIEEKDARKELPKLLSEKKATAVAFLADQAAHPKNAYWIPLFNRETTFVKGPEKYAKRYNCPVIFAGVKRTKRGHYSTYFKLITDTPQETKEEEIMRKYAKLLEEEIKQEIPLWLWSHKRWKHSKS